MNLGSRVGHFYYEFSTHMENFHKLLTNSDTKTNSIAEVMTHIDTIKNLFALKCNMVFSVGKSNGISLPERNCYIEVSISPNMERDNLIEMDALYSNLKLLNSAKWGFVKYVKFSTMPIFNMGFGSITVDDFSYFAELNGETDLHPKLNIILFIQNKHSEVLLPSDTDIVKSAMFTAIGEYDMMNKIGSFSIQELPVKYSKNIRPLSEITLDLEPIRKITFGESVVKKCLRCGISEFRVHLLKQPYCSNICQKFH